MTKYSGVGYASPFNEFSARKHIRIAINFLWHRTAFKKSYDHTFIDNDHLSIQKFEYFMSLRSGYLSLRCEDQHIVETYSPHRFSRRFGFHQDIPSDLKEEIHTGSLKDLSTNPSLIATRILRYSFQLLPQTLEVESDIATNNGGKGFVEMILPKEQIFWLTLPPSMLSH